MVKPLSRYVANRSAILLRQMNNLEGDTDIQELLLSCCLIVKRGCTNISWSLLKPHFFPDIDLDPISRYETPLIQKIGIDVDMRKPETLMPGNLPVRPV